MKKNYLAKQNKVKEDKEKRVEAMFVTTEDLKEFGPIFPASNPDEEDYLL